METIQIVFSKNKPQDCKSSGAGWISIGESVEKQAEIGKVSEITPRPKPKDNNDK
jgi:hypothetical protein